MKPLSRRAGGGARIRPAATALAAAAAAVLLAAAAAPAGAAAEPRTADSRGPSPGDLLDARRTTFRALPGVPSNTEAWTVRYRSTSADGRPNAVSGTVLIPRDGRNPGVPRPLVSYAVGTVGMGDRCAPSRTLPEGTAAEGVLIAGALARGWAVAVTDYEGLGTPGDHTYTVGRAEGTAVLDAARAAQRLPSAARHGVSGKSPVGLMGYSQGGQAGGWAAEMHDSYAPELRVRGTAAGGVPADLMAVAEGNDGNAHAGLVLMAAVGHDAAFPRLDLDRYLNEEGRGIAGYLREHCVEEATEAGAGKRIDDVTVHNPLRSEDWQRALEADRLGTGRPSRPVYLYHGTADEIIPYPVGKQLRRDWCARGTSVTWRSHPLLPHVGAGMAGSAPAMNWLAARFAGAPSPGNC